MGIKRISSIIFAAVLALLLCFPVGATNGGTILSFGRVDIYMPEIAVELKRTGYDAKDITASLGTEPLTVSSVEGFDPVKDTVCTYIVVDLSTSMTGSFSKVIANINSYVNAMKDTDRLVLITFGETVKTVLSGGENKADILDAVSKLKCNESGTMFYEALNRAYELSNANQSGFSREYVLVFSDGMDYQKGNATFNESMKLYGTHTLPLYAVCTPNASQEAADKFGEIARASGGALTMLSGNTEEVFNSFIETINNVTILKLKANSNIAAGDTRQLSIKIGEVQAELNVSVTRSIPDSEAPEATKVTVDSDNKTLAIHFSENVKNADKAASFDITEESGRKLSILEVKYLEDRQITNLTLQAGYIGNYTISFNGITDTSKEANKLIKSIDFKLDQDFGVPADAPSGFPTWIILAIVGGVILIGLAIAIILIVLRKKASSDDFKAIDEIPVRPDSQRIQNEYESGGVIDVKHHIKVPNSVRVSLQVKTGKTSEQKIEVDIVSSLIVGRSNTCDLYVDDNKMSRQHFVIENENGTLMIVDLDSTNGTMLNGIKVGGRQRLNSGDKIYAGLSDILILFNG